MGWLKKFSKKAAKVARSASLGNQIIKAAGLEDSKAYAFLNPVDRLLKNHAEGASTNLGNVLDPGGFLHGKPVTDEMRKEMAAKAAAAEAAAQAEKANLNNPWAKFGFTPGIGYTAGPGGNPFEGVMSQIPQEFFQNPQAQAALAQMLGGGGAPAPAPSAPPVDMSTPQNFYNPFAGLAGVYGAGTPGPDPSQATMMGRVGGFGNGGGKMSIPGRPGMRIPGRSK